MNVKTYNENWTELKNSIFNASGNREEMLEEVFKAVQKYEANTFHPTISIIGDAERLAFHLK